MEQARLQEDLTIGNGDNIGGNVGGNIARLGFDDGQSGHAAAAGGLVQPCRPLQKAGVQVEHIAGIGLASGRPLEQQGNLAICRRLLAQIVVNDQHILPLIHKVFADGSAGIGGDIEHRRRLRG